MQADQALGAEPQDMARRRDWKKWVRILFEKGGIAVGLVLLSLVFTAASPHFLTVSNVLNIIRQTAMMAIIAAGMTYVIITAEIDLSVGSNMALAGAVMALAIVAWGQPIPVAILLALIAGTLVGLINGFGTAIVGIPSFVVTLAMMTVLRGLCYVLLDGKTIPVAEDGFRYLGRGLVFDAIPVPAVILAIVFVAAWFILNRTKYGRWILAVGSNPEAARLSGIKVKLVKLGTFAFLGFLTALSGVILASRIGSGSPLSGNGMELDAIASVVVGGTSMYGGSGSIVGTLLGALVIGVLSNGLNLLGVNPYVQLMSSGLVILLAVGLNRLRALR